MLVRGTTSPWSGLSRTADQGQQPSLRLGTRSGAPGREAISTAFVESTVNQIISTRMVKKQHMRWTPRGAHLLLQIRTRILNNDLTHDFHRWYPSFTHTTTDRHDLAA